MASLARLRSDQSAGWGNIEQWARTKGSVQHYGMNGDRCPPVQSNAPVQRFDMLRRAQRAADRRRGEVLQLAVPDIPAEEVFALKGGTAINLFIHDLPRFSIDIDLVYLPVEDRAASRKAIQNGFGRIVGRLRASIGASVVENQSSEGTRMIVRSGSGSVQIKVELSPVLRGTVFEPEMRSVSEAVEDRFGFAEIKVVSRPDLYAGKIAAALDRQHPRDLFDVKYLYASGGITDDIFRTFLVYLVSRPQPAHEVLQSGLHSLADEYRNEFKDMTVYYVSLEALLATRKRLIEEVGQRDRAPEAREFLLSFFACKPEWSALGLETDISALPAVRWKLQNLEKLRDSKPEKLAEQLERISAALA